MPCTVRTTARSQCCWLCEYVLATHVTCESRALTLSSSLCSVLLFSSLSLPQSAPAILSPSQCTIFCAIMETQIKWLDSSQLEREAWGMQHAANGNWDCNWYWDWQAAYLVAGMTGSRDRINIASCAGGQQCVCVADVCCCCCCVLLVLSAQMFV